MKNILLHAEKLTTFYGEHKILDELDFKVFEKEIVMIVGANGAGKSTLLKSLFGLVQHMKGNITIEDELVHPTPYRMVELGLSFVPQNFRVFPNMTVEENIRIGAYILDDKNLVQQRLREIYDFLPILKTKSNHLAYTLSGGQRQIVALARALMLKPKLLFLDEPSVGLAPKIVTEVFEKVKELNEKFHTSVVIVEHNLKSLLTIADRAVILGKGKILKEGTPKEIMESKVLEEVFFGDMA